MKEITKLNLLKRNEKKLRVLVSICTARYIPYTRANFDLRFIKLDYDKRYYTLTKLRERLSEKLIKDILEEMNLEDNERNRNKIMFKVRGF
jgi:hypothetical protein